MSFPMPQLTVTAPAKINLHLAVLDKRPDGFHNLESVFLALDFGDTLYFEQVSGENTAEITMEGLNFTLPPLPPEKNIIFQALYLFREKTRYSVGLKIRVEKRIPIGGGLGGGSSDAAAALLAFNKLAGSPLTSGELLEMGASLGSDVPFFLYETTAALVTGRGERIRPIVSPLMYFVLVNPGFSSSTAAAFALLDEYRDLHGIIRNVEKYDQSVIMLADDPSRWSFKNDFLPVFKEPEKSVYNEIIYKLKESGADFAGLSGSGSTCFGVFKERGIAEKTAASFIDSGYKLTVCQSK